MQRTQNAPLAVDDTVGAQKVTVGDKEVVGVELHHRAQGLPAGDVQEPPSSGLERVVLRKTQQ